MVVTRKAQQQEKRKIQFEEKGKKYYQLYKVYALYTFGEIGMASTKQKNEVTRHSSKCNKSRFGKLKYTRGSRIVCVCIISMVKTKTVEEKGLLSEKETNYDDTMRCDGLWWENFARRSKWGGNVVS